MKKPDVLYLDTCIISLLAKEPELWNGFARFLEERGLVVGLSGAQVAELSEAPGLHTRLADLLESVPVTLIKTADVIRDEEVGAHPSLRVETLEHSDYPGKRSLLNHLASPLTQAVRQQQVSDARVMVERIAEGRTATQPIASEAQRRRKQAQDFVWQRTTQLLAGTNLAFLQQFKNTDLCGFHADVFLSEQVQGYLIFYKYYVQDRDSSRGSEFADLFHLYALPYCKAAVLERDLCEVLGQIKRRHRILTNTELWNADFLKKLRDY